MIPARTSAALWAVGAALVVFAARAWEIRSHASAVPLNDQWFIEGAQLLLPWFDGTLRASDFFLPHYEHVPLWTRLLAWLQVVLTGRWDPLVQMAVNAVLHATFVGVMVHWIAGSLGRVGTACGTGLLIALSSAPHAWENITWGFQSQFPLALLALAWHVRGSFTHAPGTRGWWAAQAVGIAGLFTLGSMALAPLAVVLVQLWSGGRVARTWMVPAAIAAVGLGLALTLRVEAQVHLAANAESGPLRWLHATLDFLGWPTGWAGGAVLINLPLLLLGLQLRGRSEASAFDRGVLALGIWSVGQALALAYARGGDYSGYISRYGDLFAVGVLANGLALVRLVPRRGFGRILAVGFALVWSVAIAISLHRLSTTGHTRYFHERSAVWQEQRTAAVRAFVQSEDRSLLEAPTARSILFGTPEVVVRVLSHPRIRAALATEVNPANPPDRLGRMVRALLQMSWLPAALGLVALAGALMRGGPVTAPAPWPWPRDQVAAIVCAVLSLASAAALTLWPSPLSFGRTARWERFLNPPDVVRDIEYNFVGEAPLARDRLWGAAEISPPEYRNWFAGTRPDPAIATTTIESATFAITTPWLILPVAGFPSAEGNALRVQVLAEDGAPDREIAFAGPNPHDIFFWAVEVSAHQGRQVRVRMEDRRGETEDWLAVGPPVLAADGERADALARGLALERLAQTHTTLGWIALVAAALAIGFGVGARRSRTAH